MITVKFVCIYQCSACSVGLQSLNWMRFFFFVYYPPWRLPLIYMCLIYYPSMGACVPTGRIKGLCSGLCMIINLVVREMPLYCFSWYGVFYLGPAWTNVTMYIPGLADAPGIPGDITAPPLHLIQSEDTASIQWMQSVICFFPTTIVRLWVQTVGLSGKTLLSYICCRKIWSCVRDLTHPSVFFYTIYTIQESPPS